MGPPQYPSTPAAELYAASSRGNASTVAALLRLGADPNASVDAVTGSTALHAALIGGHHPVTKLLLDKKAKAETADKKGNFALHACAASPLTAMPGDEVGLAIAKRLLETDGVRVSVANDDGVTAVHLAAHRGKRELLELLASHGAPLLAVDLSGRDALSFVTDAATEGTLLGLISAATLEEGREPPAVPARVSKVPWNLTDPGQTASAKVETRALIRPKQKKKAAAVGTNKAAHNPLGKEPPMTVPAPGPPPSEPPKPSARVKATSGAEDSIGATARVGRPLTAAEQRRRAYLAAYLSPLFGAKPDDDKAQNASQAAEAEAKDEKAVELAAPMSESARLQERLIKCFRSADRDGSHTVSKRELFKALEAVGITAFSSSEGLALFQEADVDGDGQLSFDEFARIARKLKPLLTSTGAVAATHVSEANVAQLSKKTRAQLRKAFSNFDTDNSGWISLAELNGALRQCGMFVPETQLRKMFDEADLDKSGGIDLDEFETLSRRLMAPYSHGAAEGAPKPPAPADNSAVAYVFGAFESAEAGAMAAKEVPRALKLLAIDPDEPHAAKLVERWAEVHGGAIDRKAFGELAHKLLCRDFSLPPSKASKPAAAASAKGGAGGRGGGKAQKEAEAEVSDARTRLARAFVLCESHERGSIAARDVPSTLWQAGLVSSAEKLHTLRPKPSHAAARIFFDELVVIAFGEKRPEPQPSGKADAKAAAEPSAPLRTLHVRADTLTLAPWVISSPAVENVSLVVRGAVHPDDVFRGPAAPLVLRSASQRKQSSPIEMHLEAVLPPSTTFVTLELYHEGRGLPGQGGSVLGRAELDLGRLYGGASYPLPYTLPLYDARAMQVGTVELTVESRGDGDQPGVSALAPAAAKPDAAKYALPAVSATELAALEAELDGLRTRASELQRSNDRIAFQLRTEQRLRSGAPSSALPSSIQKAYAPANRSDWRSSGADAVAFALSTSRRRPGGGTPAITTALEQSLGALKNHVKGKAAPPKQAVHVV